MKADDSALVKPVMFYNHLAYKDPFEINAILASMGFEQCDSRTYSSMRWIKANHIEAFVVPVRVPALWGKRQRGWMLVIRGTDDLQDWMTDFRFLPKQYEVWPGKVHRGFANGALWLWNHLQPIIEYGLEHNIGRKPWLVTGHSLGGALAALVAPLLHDAGIKTSLLTFAAPRVGNRAFAKAAYTKLPRTERHVNNNDIVPRVPPSICAAHYGHEVYYGTDGFPIPRNTFGRLIDRIHGRIHAMDEPGLDGLKDHGPQAYLDLAFKNPEFQPEIIPV